MDMEMVWLCCCWDLMGVTLEVATGVPWKAEALMRFEERAVVVAMAAIGRELIN